MFSDAVIQSRGTGLARYAREIRNGLLKRPEIESVRIASAYGDPENPEHQSIGRELDMTFIPGGRRRTALRWTFLDRPPMEKYLGEVDIIHVTELGYPLSTRKPLVVTVHDIGPISHPRLFGKSHPWLMARALKRVAKQADAIISGAEAAADEVRKFLKNDGLPITVIHHGVAQAFKIKPAPALLEKIPGMPPPGTPYFFFVGSLNPRKNMLRILDAFEIAAREIPHHMVAAGQVGWDHQSTLNRFETSRIRERIHWIGNPEDPEMAALYSGATALVFPSLFEGFGLPVIEAMACGCPVITSNRSTLPEAAGGAAILVDPENTREIARAMTDLAGDQAARASMIEKGREHAARFTWERSVEGVIKVYQRVLGS